MPLLHHGNSAILYYMKGVRKDGTLHICVAMARRVKAARDRFSGIMRYAATHSNWVVRILDPPPSGESGPGIYKLSNEISDDEPLDGAIGRTDILIRHLGARALSIPIVDIDSGPLPQGFPKRVLRIKVDNAAIADAAARLLLGKGLRNLAFVGEVSSKFANGSCQPYRRETFRAAALAAGATFHEFTETTDNQTDNMPELMAWLRTLPLPCGIMAFNDIRALTVIDACHLARLTVPGQIQIVGVDNEVEICENTYPTLTSVLPDFEGGGYMAAQWLDEILENGMPRNPPTLEYGVKTIVERASTCDLRGGGRIVATACEFIRIHAGEDIAVADIAKALNVSRRTLELRFSEILGRGVGETLCRERLDRVSRLLRETDRTVLDICFDSGFKSPSYLKALFKKTYGMTMSEWRGRGGGFSA